MIVSLLLVLFSVYVEEHKQRERNSTNNTCATGMNEYIYFDYLLYERCFFFNVIRMAGNDKKFYSDNISVESLEYGNQAIHFMSHGHISEQYLIIKFYYHHSSDLISTTTFTSSTSTRYLSISSLKSIVRKYNIILSESPYSF